MPAMLCTVTTYYLESLLSYLNLWLILFPPQLYIGKEAPHLETNSALVTPFPHPNLLIHTLLSYFTVHIRTQLGLLSCLFEWPPTTTQTRCTG